jgi:hypothetical protein
MIVVERRRSAANRSNIVTKSAANSSPWVLAISWLLARRTYRLNARQKSYTRGSFTQPLPLQFDHLLQNRNPLAEGKTRRPCGYLSAINSAPATWEDGKIKKTSVDSQNKSVDNSGGHSRALSKLGARDRGLPFFSYARKRC